MNAPLTESLRRSPPRLHDSPDYWGLAWDALAWVEANTPEGTSTLETGAGASTMVFAARRAHHHVITPDPEEERRIRAACQERGLDASRSLSTSGARTRSFPGSMCLRSISCSSMAPTDSPIPILDWWHLAPRLKTGGRMLLDDAYLPGIAAIVDYVRASEAWELEPPISFRTARIRKLRDDDPPNEADARAAHGRMSFGYLPPGRRVVASARTRLFSTKAGIWTVRKLRGPR